MALQVATVSIELIHLLRPLAERIRRRDHSLADQLVRAASSIALNVAEADRSQGGNVLARFHSAAGSASETRTALHDDDASVKWCPAAADCTSALVQDSVERSLSTSATGVGAFHLTPGG
jgi:hypothetical protein